MNISRAARATGLTTKTIRYYESIGLVSPAYRQDNGYRGYSDQNIRDLLFIAQARQLGFSLKECAELMSRYQDKDRKSADVKELALRKISDLDDKISQLQSIREHLKEMVECCHGNEQPDCPIIDSLTRTG